MPRKSSLASASMDAESRRYRAEDDTRTLSRAEEIRADAARMREVKAHAKRQIDTLSKIHGRGKKR